MRFHASFADSCIDTRKRWGIDQGREMLRNGCGKVNRATNRATALLTARKSCARKDGELLSQCARGGGAARVAVACAPRLDVRLRVTTDIAECAAPAERWCSFRSLQSPARTR